MLAGSTVFSDDDLAERSNELLNKPKEPRHGKEKETGKGDGEA